MKYSSLFTIPFMVIAVESTSTPSHEREWYEIGKGMGTQRDNKRDKKTKLGHAIASSASGNIVAVSSPQQAMGDITVGLDMDMEEANEFDNDPDKPGINMSLLYYPRVQVFEFNPLTDQWEKPSADIEAFDPMVEFGVSLAMDASGSTLVVGALDDGKFGSKDAGSVTIYRYDPIIKTWMPKGTNHRIEGITPFEQFGSAVDMSDDGNVIVVGSPNKDAIVDDADFPRGGQVTVFKHNPVEDAWNILGGPIRGEIFDRLGSSVSIAYQLENNMYIVAAGAPTSGLYEAGYVQIFRLVDEGEETNKKWMTNIEAKIMGDADGDHFGSSVALNRNGTVFVAGAPHHKGFTLKKKSGHARVYKMNGNNIWKQVHESIVGFREGEESGSSVAISPDGERIVVGSPLSMNNGKHSGHASVYYLYDEEGSNQIFWDKMDLDIDGIYANDFTGTSVAMAMNGDRVVIGSPGGGYARVFELLRTAPPTMTPTLAPEGPSLDWIEDDERFRGVTMEILIIVFGLILPLILVLLILAWERIYSMKNRGRNELVPGTDTPTPTQEGNVNQRDDAVVPEGELT